MQGWETTKRCKVHVTEKKHLKVGKLRQKKAESFGETMGKRRIICQGKDYTGERQARDTESANEEGNAKK